MTKYFFFRSALVLCCLLIYVDLPVQPYLDLLSCSYLTYSMLHLTVPAYFPYRVLTSDRPNLDLLLC